MLSLNSPNAIRWGCLPQCRLNRGDERRQQDQELFQEALYVTAICPTVVRLASSTAAWASPGRGAARHLLGRPLPGLQQRAYLGVVGRQLLVTLARPWVQVLSAQRFLLGVEQWRGVLGEPAVGSAARSRSSVIMWLANRSVIPSRVQNR